VLSDLKRLVDKDERLDAQDFSKAASLLLERQFLYSDKSRDRRHYHIIANNLNYFTDLFRALDRSILMERDFGMVGLLPGETTHPVHLKIEETFFLLCLRLIYEEKLEAFESDHGMVHTDSEALLSRYTSLTKRPRPLLTELRAIINAFSRHGLLEKGPEEFKTLNIRIRPAIRYVLPEDYLTTLESFIQDPTANADEEAEDCPDETENSDEGDVDEAAQ
jgi:hypothetical protein